MKYDRWLLILAGSMVFTACGGDKGDSRIKAGDASLPEREEWKENSAALRATVMRVEMRNPYDYTLHMRVDSVLALEAEDVIVQQGDSLAAFPNFTYLAPGILDMRWQANQSLSSLARTTRGQKIVVLVSRAGSRWMLEDGEKEVPLKE
jgi:hypothetical protein